MMLLKSWPRFAPITRVSRATTRMSFQLTIRQVAFKRFVDYISMIIDFELLKGFERTLNDALYKGLGLGEDQLRQRCSTFLKEDPDIVRRRDSLHQDLERFEAALADLQRIPVLDPNHGDSRSGYNTEADKGHLTDRAIFSRPSDLDDEPKPEPISRSQSPMKSSLYVPEDQGIFDEDLVAGSPLDEHQAEDWSFAFNSPLAVSPSASKKKKKKAFGPLK